MAQTVPLYGITPALGQWLTNQVLTRDDSILSVMMVDSSGTVLGHGLRHGNLDLPIVSSEAPIAVPVLNGRMLVFLRLASKARSDAVYAKVSEFFSLRADYMAT